MDLRTQARFKSLELLCGVLLHRYLESHDHAESVISALRDDLKSLAESEVAAAEGIDKLTYREEIKQQLLSLLAMPSQITSSAEQRDTNQAENEGQA